MARPEQAEVWLAEFGQRVRSHRERLGLTQVELAIRAGLDSTYISGIERGRRNVSLINIHVLAAAFHVSASEFFPRIGDTVQRKGH